MINDVMAAASSSYPPSGPAEHEIQFAVYAHYLTALSQVVVGTHGSLDGMAKSMTASLAVQKLQQRKLDPVSLKRVRQSLRHAWFTELQAFLPATFEGALPYTNHWLPVQVYYSVYLALRAYFVARGVEVGQSHESTLRAVQAEILSHPDLHSVPWNVMAVGDPSLVAPTLKNCPEPAIEYVNPLTSPKKGNAWNLVAQFLRTTRQRRFDDRVTDWRKAQKAARVKAARANPSAAAILRAKVRPNLSAEARKALCDALRPTTLFDALYRLRIRSNYEDADAYIFGGTNAVNARGYHDALSQIRNGAMLNFEVLVARLIGPEVFLRTADAFLHVVRIPLSDLALARRVKAIRSSI